MPAACQDVIPRSAQARGDIGEKDRVACGGGSQERTSCWIDSAAQPCRRRCRRRSRRYGPAGAVRRDRSDARRNRRLSTPPLPSTASAGLPCRTVRIVASGRAEGDRARPAGPASKVTNRTMRRRRSRVRRLRIGAGARSAQVLSGGSLRRRGQAGSAWTRWAKRQSAAALVCGSSVPARRWRRRRYLRTADGRISAKCRVWSGLRSRDSSRSYISSSGDRRSIVAPVAG